MRMNDSPRLIFELSAPGRLGHLLPPLDVPAAAPDRLIPGQYLRRHPLRLPEVSENEVMRHFVNLSVRNHHIDRGFYPLGSCTMKYNPKVNEDVARLPGMARIHPWQPAETVQGALALMDELEGLLREAAGMDAVTLQPAAGAQGELTGLLIARAHHLKRGRPRGTVLIPDSAHGTNPASVTIAGMTTVTVRSNARGRVDLEDLDRHLSDDTAVFMLTNPNTLGLFESQIEDIASRVHRAGGLMYMDGANFNALLGIARPGDMGFDIVHINLHKTFSTPHGGGGPGAGPVGVKAALEPFLPAPRIGRRGEAYYWNADRPDSIGRVHSFHGNFGMLVRAYAYIHLLGRAGLRTISETAIINANYLMHRLSGLLDVAYPGPCMHEFVLSAERCKKATGVKTLDIAKRLLDFGVHAPTTYFPLIVKEALMIEPTESESRETLDQFAAVCAQILREAATEPARVTGAPHTTPVGRLDEAGAARQLDVRYTPPTGG